MSAPGTSGYDYDEAFSRNIGLLSEEEQARVRAARVAVAGLGGVGGNHVLALARIGFGSFSLADLDHFELANMNRQAGASVDTLGRSKVEVTVRSSEPSIPARTCAFSSTARWRPWTVSIFSIWTRGVCYFVRPEPAASTR